MMKTVRRSPWLLVQAVLLGLLMAPAGAQAPTGNPPQKPKPEEEQKEPEQEELKGPATTVTVEEKLREIPTENTTATKMALPLQKTPASVGVVSSAVIRSQDADVLIDALKNISGVNVNTGFGVFDFFTIRGFDSLSSGLVMTDGAIEPQSTFYQMYNIDRVEVLKGPIGFLYGGRSLSGTVNLVRKQPIFRNFGEVSLSYGRFQDYQGTVDLNVADPTGRVAFRLNGMYQDAENYRIDKQHWIGAFNPAVTWRVTDNSTLTVNFEYVKNDFEPDSGLPLIFNTQLPDVDRRASYQAPFDISRQDVHRFRVDYETRLSDRAVFRNKFYYTNLEWTSNGTLLGGAFPNAQGSVDVIRFFNALNDRQRFTGNQTEILFTAETGALRHQIVAGLELAKFADAFGLEVDFLPSIDLFNPVETAQPEFLFPIPGQSQAGDARSIVVAPYFLDRISFSDQFQLFAGGRLDHIDYKDDAIGLRRNDTQFSPMLGAVFSPIPSVAIYANAGKSFSPPSTLVQRERRPEEGTQYEVGLKNEFLRGKVRTSLSFYHLVKDNIAIFDDNGVTQQLGDQRSRGVEVELGTEFLEDWYSAVSYSYNDAELTRFNEFVQVSQAPPQFVLVDRSGNRPSFAPQHLFHCWTIKQFANGIGLGIGARFVGEQFIAEDNTFRLNDYVLVDAMVSYTHSRWSVALNLKNLTDTDYETRGFGASSVIPGDPFAAYGTLRYAFDF